MATYSLSPAETKTITLFAPERSSSATRLTGGGALEFSALACIDAAPDVVASPTVNTRPTVTKCGTRPVGNLGRPSFSESRLVVCRIRRSTRSVTSPFQPRNKGNALTTLATAAGPSPDASRGACGVELLPGFHPRCSHASVCARGRRTGDGRPSRPTPSEPTFIQPSSASATANQPASLGRVCELVGISFDGTLERCAKLSKRLLLEPANTLS